jgi:hypothetical protein
LVDAAADAAGGGALRAADALAFAFDDADDPTGFVVVVESRLHQ